ncbi:hypothetical protein BG842_16975 [Haladaptatus sp. W1]|uniref:DUF5518 domain-containing protein n=1 Tax=Haladaptatus sp. W1 TaxID=1897478 RepID=UPI000849748E|nr:DUF5518 domain-containing protein [Haladaptatus sp. W1]ODR80698.1 hypothetical protein BG842_16975 [Haladaptatus sp. W1]
MSLIRNLLADVTGEEFRLAVLLGVASIPVTVWQNWILTPNALPRNSNASALFVACVIAGYCYQQRPAASSRAGTITGVVGGTPIVLWQSAIGFSDAWGAPIVGDPVLLPVVVGGLVFILAAFLFVVVSFVGRVGGGIGGWLSERLHSPRLLDSTA